MSSYIPKPGNNLKALILKCYRTYNSPYLLFHYILRWIFMEKTFLLPKQMYHLSIREQQQAFTTECISSNESLFNKGTLLVSYSHFPDPCSKLSKTYIHTTYTKEWPRMGTSCQVTVPAARPAD